MAEQTLRENETHFRGAGRSLKGTRSVINHDFVYCRDVPFGVYAVADGSEGTCLWDRASEIAVATLRDAVRERAAGSEPQEFLADAMARIDSALLAEKREDGGRLASAVVICCVENGMAHIACCGGVAAYLVDHGRITRLTEDAAVENLEEAAAAERKAGMIPAGWGGVFEPQATSCRLGPKSLLLLCTRSVISRLGNVAIQEIAQGSATIEICADNILEAAHAKENSADVSVVAIGPSEGLREGGAYVETISYPAASKAGKIVVVAAMAAIIGAAMLYWDSTERRMEEQSPARTTRQDKSAGKSAETEKGRFVFSRKRNSNEGTVSIAGTPEGARVFVNGVEQEGRTPLKLNIRGGDKIDLRVESAGFATYKESLVVKAGEEIERALNLKPVNPLRGSLMVRCSPYCDAISLDGVEISATPRSEMTLREVPLGRHIIEARRGEAKDKKEVRVTAGTIRTAQFVLKEERPATAKAAGKAPAVEVVEAAPEEPKRSRNQEISDLRARRSPAVIPVRESIPQRELKKESRAEETKKNEQAVFVVNTNVENCNIMVFQNGTLAATGFSGSRITVEPGKYTVTATGDGYEDASTDVYINKGYQVFSLKLEK